MNQLMQGWFSEVNNFWPGQALSLKVDEVLFHEKSLYQDVLVLKTSHWGNVLVLDGVIQITERDEFSYQEMITHLPMFTHPNPKKVAIVGGGDGGVLREVVKHKGVEEVHMLEIDLMVIESSKKYLPSISNGAFDDPRFKLHVDDAAVTLKKFTNYFDVIIVDSSDPEGPARSLFEKGFFETCHAALNENGTICNQAESIWLHLDFIASITPILKEVWTTVNYAYISVPTYPSGGIGFFLCTKNIAADKKPLREESKEFYDSCRYYSQSVHSSVFVLPSFVQRRLEL
jgi:spermidine synthase